MNPSKFVTFAERFYNRNPLLLIKNKLTTRNELIIHFRAGLILVKITCTKGNKKSGLTVDHNPPG
jgi:hypothetical protein